MSRAKKAPAKATDVRRLLSLPVRPLTTAERKSRTSFYDEFGQQATAVEPSTYARSPR